MLIIFVLPARLFTIPIVEMKIDIHVDMQLRRHCQMADHESEVSLSRFPAMWVRNRVIRQRKTKWLVSMDRNLLDFRCCGDLLRVRAKPLTWSGVFQLCFFAQNPGVFLKSCPVLDWFRDANSGQAFAAKEAMGVLGGGSESGSADRKA